MKCLNPHCTRPAHEPESCDPGTLPAEERLKQGDAMTETYPVVFNGYVPVPVYSQRVAARDVLPGDTLLLDACPVKVHRVEDIALTGWAKGTAVKIEGTMNMIRFGFEPVTVLRAPEPETPQDAE